MTVTMTTRFTIGDAEIATAESKRAKTMWMNAGAKEFRASQFYTGEFNGKWLFHVVFDDFAHLQKCRDVVINSKDWQTLQMNNAKAGNKLVAREIILGMDI